MEASLPIVVGNDGSDFARLALRKALWLAAQLKTDVRVIRAWSISTAPRPSTWSPGFVPPADDFEAVVRERLQREVEPIAAEYPDVKSKIFGAMQRLPIEGWGVGDAAVVVQR